MGSSQHDLDSSIMSFTVTKKEIKDCKPLTHRERFVYIVTSLVLNPVVQNLTRERRDKILMKLRDELCPNVTNADWWVIFNEIEKNRSILVNEIRNILTDDEMKNIHGKWFSLLGSKDIESITGNMVSKVKEKLEKI